MFRCLSLLAVLLVSLSVAMAVRDTGSLSGNAGIAAATLTLSGQATATTTAGATGNYSFGGLMNGSYTVTPSLAGYNFSPSQQTVRITGGSVSGINFTAAAIVVPTYSISGNTGVAAKVYLSGAAAATTASDANGNYVFSKLANGTYAVTPSASGYRFSPSSASAVVNGANVSGVNFTASLISVSVVVTPTSVNLTTGATQQFNQHPSRSLPRFRA